MRLQPRYWHLAAVAALALVGACSDETPLDADEPPRATPGQPRAAGYVAPDFVYAEGASFKVNGKAFRHVGVNAPQLLYQTDDQIRHTLNMLHASGVKVVRVFLPNDVQPGNSWDPSFPRQRLGFLLREAYELRGIRVTVALTQSYLQKVDAALGGGGYLAVYGDRAGGFYSRPTSVENQTLYALDDRWIDWGYARSGGYRDFTWAIVSAFATHPGIFSWDIANELNVSDTWNRWLVEREVAFYKDAARLIKEANGRRQMVTTGVISAFWAGFKRPGWDFQSAIYDDPNIDYVVVHHYDNDATNEQLVEVDRYRATKPVIVEEFGMRGARTDFSLVQNYFTDLYANRGADAINQWGVQFSCPETGGDDWGSGDDLFGPCEQRRIRQYMGLWARWAGQLDLEGPRVVDNYNENNDKANNWAGGAGWTSSTYSPEFWYTGYQFSTANGGETGESDAFVFKFNLPGGGCWYVDTWYNANSSRSSSVPYVGYNASGGHVGTRYVNQQVNGDRWTPVGQYCFTPGMNQIRISRWTGAPGYIIADAIRLRR